jgi:hypothetical protein
LRGIFLPCEKRANFFLDFSNIKWWAPYSWGTNLSMYSPYSQPYLSGFMLINLKMSLLHSVRFLLVRLLNVCCPNLVNLAQWMFPGLLDGENNIG